MDIVVHLDIHSLEQHVSKIILQHQIILVIQDGLYLEHRHVCLPILLLVRRIIHVLVDGHYQGHHVLPPMWQLVAPIIHVPVEVLCQEVRVQLTNPMELHVAPIIHVQVEVLCQEVHVQSTNRMELHVAVITHVHLEVP